MVRAAKVPRQPGLTPLTKVASSAAGAERVGITELRGNLAKYLKQAKAGRVVIIQERGRSAYVLASFAAAAPASVLGCMRSRTEYTSGATLGATEDWDAGSLP